ncbi:MAG: DUF1559 domain-containing protein [Planctomycetaceae bacterium]|nr:DUF1559 domain-containing protein [Planctomycetaceae bacterium]
MSIRIACRNGHKLKVKDSLVGKKVRCPKCKATIVIPVSVTDEDLLDSVEDDVAPQSPPARQTERRQQDVSGDDPPAASHSDLDSPPDTELDPWDLPDGMDDEFDRWDESPGEEENWETGPPVPRSQKRKRRHRPKEPVKDSDIDRRKLVWLAGGGGALLAVLMLGGGLFLLLNDQPDAGPPELAQQASDVEKSQPAQIATTESTETSTPDEAAPAITPEKAITPQKANAPDAVVPAGEIAEPSVVHLDEMPGTSRSLLGSPSAVAFDSHTGVLATLDDIANEIVIYQPSYFDGDDTAHSERFKGDGETPVNGLALKPYQDKLFLVVTSEQGFSLYDAATLEPYDADGRMPKTFRDNISMRTPSGSPNPNDPHVYFGSYVVRQEGRSKKINDYQAVVLDLEHPETISGLSLPSDGLVVSPSGRIVTSRSSDVAVLVQPVGTSLERRSWPGNLCPRVRAQFIDPYEQFFVFGQSFRLNSIDSPILRLNGEGLAVLPNDPFILSLQSTGSHSLKEGTFHLHHRDTAHLRATFPLDDSLDPDSEDKDEQRVAVRGFPVRPEVFVDASRNRFIMVRGVKVRVVPIDELPLPDEPLLATRIDLPPLIEPMQFLDIPVASSDPRVDVSLVSAPDGVTLEDGRLQWTPGIEHIGRQLLTFRLTSGVTSKDQTLQTIVSYRSVPLPFEPRFVVTSHDGQRAFVWSNWTSGYYDDPDGPTKIAIVDTDQRRVTAVRDFPYRVVSAVVTPESVCLIATSSTGKLPPPKDRSGRLLMSLDRNDLSILKSVTMGSAMAELTRLNDRQLLLHGLGKRQIEAILETDLTLSPLTNLLPPGGASAGRVFTDPNPEERIVLPRIVLNAEQTAIVEFASHSLIAHMGSTFAKPIFARHGDSPFGLEEQNRRTARDRMIPILADGGQDGPLVADINKVIGQRRVIIAKNELFVIEGRNLQHDGQPEVEEEPEQPDQAKPPLPIRVIDPIMIAASDRAFEMRFAVDEGTAPFTFTAQAANDSGYNFFFDGAKFLIEGRKPGSFMFHPKVLIDAMLSSRAQSKLNEALGILGRQYTGKTLDDYLEDFRVNLQPLLNHKFRGVPCSVGVSAWVQDADGRAGQTAQTVILDLPRDLVEPLWERAVGTRQVSPLNSIREIKATLGSQMPLLLPDDFSAVELSNIIRAEQVDPPETEDLVRNTVEKLLNEGGKLVTKVSDPIRVPIRTWRTTDGISMKGKLSGMQGNQVQIDVGGQIKQIPLGELREASISILWQDLLSAQDRPNLAMRKETSPPRSSREPEETAIGQAIKGFVQTYGFYPPRALVDAQGKPLLSWRVLILPFLREYSLYYSFRLDEPWDSPHNRKLMEFMPRVFDTHPVLLEPGFTGVLAVVGENTCFPPRGLRRPEDLTDPDDEVLQVLMVGVRKSVEWTKPEDFELGEDGASLSIIAEPVPIDEAFPKNRQPPNFVFGQFADYTRKKLPPETDPALLFEAATINDGRPENLLQLLKE